MMRFRMFSLSEGKAPQVPPGADDGLVERTMDIFVLAVEHLMFDSAYLEALRRCLRTGTNSDSLVETEDVPVGDNCPIIPRFLTPELRARWIEDITGLTNYAMEKGLGGSGEAHKPPSAPSSPPSKADTHRDANRQLYQVNKELASANATMEGKLDRIRGTLGSLTTKIADKTGENVVASDPVGRISATIRMLLLSQSEDHGENKGMFQSWVRSSVFGF